MKSNKKDVFKIKRIIIILLFVAYCTYVVISFSSCYFNMLNPTVIDGIKGYAGLLAPLFVAISFLCVNLFIKHHIKISVVLNVIILIFGLFVEVYPNQIGISYNSLYSVSDLYTYPIAFDDASAYYSGVNDVLPDVSIENENVTYLYLSRFGYQTNIYLKVSNDEAFFNSVIEQVKDCEPIADDGIKKVYDITVRNSSEWTEYSVVDETEKAVTYFVTRNAIIFNNKLITSKFDCYDIVHSCFYQTSNE